MESTPAKESPQRGRRVSRGSAARATQFELLRSAVQALSSAQLSDQPGERYAESHLAALRAAAAVVSERGRASNARGRRGGPRSVWQLLPSLAPELAEWAEFFALTARKRVLAQSLPDAVTPREADDLLRQSAQFVQLVADSLQLPLAHPLGIAV